MLSKANTFKGVLKRYDGFTRAENGEIKDKYTDIANIEIEIYDTDNIQNQYGHFNYDGDIRGDIAEYAGIIRLKRLSLDGKYSVYIKKLDKLFIVTKCHVAGNNTFLKLSLVEGA